MSKFKPLLAAAIEDTATLKYPMLASPKLDGIRCIVMDGVGYSRSLKPIPNACVQTLFSSGDYDGLDGELIVGSPTSPSCYRDTNSGVMSRDGEPDFLFYVFDRIDMPDHGFADRYEQGLGDLDLPRLGVVQHEDVHNEADLLAVEEMWLAAGYEGVMLRSLNGPYKNGRSTLKEGTLLKLKRMASDEAEIIDVIELEHNLNEATIDERGYTKRSTHQENKVGGGVMGAIVVRDIKDGCVFNIGTGFTAEDRKMFWDQRDEMVGRLVTYDHFPVGRKDLPRHPSWKGFRSVEDL